MVLLNIFRNCFNWENYYEYISFFLFLGNLKIIKLFLIFIFSMECLIFWWSVMKYTEKFRESFSTIWEKFQPNMWIHGVLRTWNSYSENIFLNIDERMVKRVTIVLQKAHSKAQAPAQALMAGFPTNF